MAFVYQYSSMCQTGKYRVRKHKATLQFIEKSNGIVDYRSKIEVPDALVNEGIYRLPLLIRSEEINLVSWGMFKAAPSMHRIRKME